MSGNSQSTPRVAAIVGPYLSGKTSLMESLLFVAGALPRKGTVKEGNTVGDASLEAKARHRACAMCATSICPRGRSARPCSSATRPAR